MRYLFSRKGAKGKGLLSKPETYPRYGEGGGNMVKDRLLLDFRLFLARNNMKIANFAKLSGIGVHSLYAWHCGSIALSEKNQKRVRSFMDWYFQW